MKEISLFFLAGGTMNSIPKCLIKTPENYTILEKILRIFFSIDYAEHNIKVRDYLVLYPVNFYEKFLEISRKLGFKLQLEEAGNTLLSTLTKVIELETNKVHDNEKFLFFVATDTPLITQEAVEDIIKRFSLLEGDLFFPFVSKEVYKVQIGKKLAQKRTFFKLAKDSFCSTGILIIKKAVLISVWEKIKNIFENRKNPLKIIKILDFDYLTTLKLIFGQMTVLELEEIISKKFNIKAQGLLTNFANLAFNIDDNKDLEDYEKIVLPNINKEKLQVL